MNQYFLWEKGQRRYFKLPETWRVLHNLALEPEKVQKTVYDMAQDSLANPISTSPLREIIKPTNKVVIIVDDFARPTPKRKF